jgi:hypothetical protein
VDPDQNEVLDVGLAEKGGACLSRARALLGLALRQLTVACVSVAAAVATESAAGVSPGEMAVVVAVAVAVAAPSKIEAILVAEAWRTLAGVGVGGANAGGGQRGAKIHPEEALGCSVLKHGTIAWPPMLASLV